MKVIYLGLLIFLLITSCKTSNSSSNITTSQKVSSPISNLEASFPFYVEDSYGKKVAFDEPPQRIVAYDAAAVEVLFALGEGDRIIATHSFVSHPENVDALPKVGDASTLDIERILELEPDLVFIFFPSFNEQLTKSGLKLLYLESLNDDFLKVTDHIRMWGRITGNTSAAESLSVDFETRVEEIKETLRSKPPGPSVFYDTFQLWTAGPDTLVGNVLNLLHVRNVGEKISGYGQISPEALVENNPDIIFTKEPKFFTDNPAFRDIKAVRNNKIYLTSDLLDVAGPRFIDGVEELARLIYPNLFP